MCELADGTVISPGTAASTLDQAAIERVVLDGPSRVLDLGYQRSFTGAARRAIEITQRHCQGRGCHIPGHRCHIDHIWRWSDGGPTHPDNGRLLCPAEPGPRTRQPPPPPPRHRTPEQAQAHLELARQRIRDRLLHDPTWARESQLAGWKNPFLRGNPDSPSCVSGAVSRGAGAALGPDDLAAVDGEDLARHPAPPRRTAGTGSAPTWSSGWPMRLIASESTMRLEVGLGHDRAGGGRCRWARERWR